MTKGLIIAALILLTSAHATSQVDAESAVRIQKYCTAYTLLEDMEDQDVADEVIGAAQNYLDAVGINKPFDYFCNQAK
jgi:hypothetical protein